LLIGFCRYLVLETMIRDVNLFFSLRVGQKREVTIHKFVIQNRLVRLFIGYMLPYYLQHVCWLG
jgi:hypothetical protein